MCLIAVRRAYVLFSLLRILVRPTRLLRKVVGFVGRLAPEKGPGLFLAVAEALAKLLPCAVFVVVGSGSLRLALEAMAGRLGIAR